MIVRELLTKLGFDADTKEAQDYGKAIDTVKKVAIAATAAVGALASGAAVLVNGMANSALEIERLSRVANTSTDEFQRMSAAAKVFGIGQDKLADILKDTNDKIGDFLQTGAGPMVDFFEQIGPKVGITKEQFKGLSGSDALALYVRGLEQANLSQAEMVFYMEAIASDSTMLLPMLKDGGKAYKELGDAAADAGAILSEETLASATKLRKEFAVVGMVMEGVRYTIGEQLLPVVSEVTASIKEWYIENKGLIRQNLPAFVRGTTNVLRYFWYMVKTVIRGVNWLVDLFGGWENVIRVATIALTALTALKVAAWIMAIVTGVKALNVAMLANPATWMTAAIVALSVAIGLLIDDIWNWVEGNDSAIGLVIGSWDDFKVKIGEVFDYINGLFGSFAEWMLNFNSNVEKALISAAQAIKNILGAAFDWVKEKATNLIPDWAIGFLPGSEPVSPDTMATQSAGAVSTSNTNTEINTKVELQVPPGTPESQVAYIKREAGPAIQDAIDSAVRQAWSNYPVAE